MALAVEPNVHRGIGWCDPAWVVAGQPLCLIGDSGTGKSHLLIGIGTAVAEAGCQVRYITAANLVSVISAPRVAADLGAQDQTAPDADAG